MTTFSGSGPGVASSDQVVLRAAVHELGTLEEWVRATVLPILITGSRNHPPLPPRLDTTTGHGSFPRALADAGQRTAAEQAVKRVQAAIARQELADVLMKHPKAANREVIAAWINTLDDDQLLGYLKRLAAASGRRELAAVDAAARAMLDAAYRVVEQIPTWPARGE